MKQHSAEHTSHQIATGRTQTIAIVRSLHGRHIFFLPRYHLSRLDCVPQKLVEVLTFDTCACGFIWKSSLCRCQQAMMRKHWIRFGPNPMTSVLLRGSVIWTQGGQTSDDGGRDEGDAHKARKVWGHRELDETRKAAPLETRRFGTSGLQNCGTMASCCFQHRPPPHRPRFVLLCYPRN